MQTRVDLSVCTWTVTLFDILALCHSAQDLKRNDDDEVKALTRGFNWASGGLVALFYTVPPVLGDQV